LRRLSQTYAWECVPVLWQSVEERTARQLTTTLEEVMSDAKLSEIAARWEWMCDLLEGKTVSEFALSFPEVRQLSVLVQQIPDAVDGKCKRRRSNT